jgi:hypothetical protein
MFIIFKHFSVKTENEFECYLKAFKTLEKETKIKSTEPIIFNSKVNFF